MLAFGLAVALASSVHADEPAEPSVSSEVETPPVAAKPAPERVEQIVITAGRRPLPRSLTGASVSVLERPTLELDQARDVLEVLRDVPSFAVVQTGSRGGTTSLFVRGGESDHNLVLIDGIQVNRGGGGFDFANLSTDGVERIEVVRGPAAALYGSDAVASVIHVITARGEGDVRVSARALTGSDRTHELAARVSGGNERFGYSLNAGRYATNGLEGINNDSDNTSLRGRFDYDPSEDLDFTLTSSYTMSSFDFPTDFVSGVRGGFPPVDPDQGRDTFEWYNGLRTTWRQSDRVEHRLLLGYVRSRFDDFDGLDLIESDFAERKSRQHEQRRTLDYQLSVEGPSYGFASTHLVLGAEYERQIFDSSSISPEPRSSFTQRRRNRASFAQLGFDLGDRALLTLSGRIDDNSELGTFFTPAASLAYLAPESDTKLRMSFSEGFKEPAFLEVFGRPGGIVGNLALDPERSRSIEIGVEQALLEGRLRLAATYFRSDFTDLISFVGAAGPGAVSTFLNVQEARTQGAELEVEIELTPLVAIGASYTFLRTRVRDAGDVGGTGFVEGEDLLRRPTHSGSFHLDVADDGWNVRIGATFVGPRSDADFGIAPDGARVRSPDYVKTDVSASLRVSGRAADRETWLLLRAENVFDAEYEEAFGFESPGRRVLVGVELRR